MNRLFLIILFFLIGCDYPPVPDEAGKLFRGEHLLRKMVSIQDENCRMSGGFFLFVGGFDLERTNEINVKFAWQCSDGSYIISSLPLEKFRIKFDEKKKEPTIKFRWVPVYANYLTSQDLMNGYVKYVLITCKEEDWPTDIKLPLNKDN